MMTDNELAEAYAAKTLGGDERKGVEKRMENDPPFAKLVKEYENTLEVLKRKWLRNNIEVAKKELWVRKIVKIGIVALAVSSLLFIATYQLLKPKHHKTKQVETISIPKLAAEEILISKDTSFVTDSIQVVPSIKHENTTPSFDFLSNFFSNEKEGFVNSISFKKDSFSAVPISSLINNDYQTFEINPKIPNLIKCKNGTIISLPANAMLLTNGTAPKGQVTIRVQEYSNYLEMYKYNVSTTSDAKLLETGGSCFIKAEANGDTVVLKKNQTYTITFDSEKDERMKTFIGDRDSAGNLNWKLDKQSKPAIQNESVVSKNGSLMSDCNCNKERYYFQTVVSDEGFYNEKTDDYSYNVLSDTKKVVKMFDTFIGIKADEIKELYKKKAKLRLRFGVDSIGRLVSYDYNFRVNKKTEKSIKLAADFVIANYQIESINKGAKNVILSVDLVPSLELINTKAIEKIKAIDSAASIEEQNKVQQNNMNIIVARSFGYVNCDFFSNQPNLTKLEVQIPTSLTDVKVFFKGFKAVVKCLNSGHVATFNNAPASATVLIVGTVMKNNLLMMVLKEAKVGEAIELKDFEPFDLNKLSEFLDVKI